MTEIYVTKKNGILEKYNPLKLEKSLYKSGATRKMAHQVVVDIADYIYPNISTKKIYSRAFQLLWRQSHYHATTYNLKNSMLQLGPGGFYFEKFIAEVFKAKGYKTTLNNVKKGCCVQHEVDVIARRPDFTIFAECKFHNQNSKKNDIKTALYVWARSLDLENSTSTEKFNEFWLISNTSFSKDAIKYAECVGLKLFGLNYPAKSALGDIICRYRLHPITCIRNLKKHHQNLLLEKGILMVKDLYKSPKILAQIGVEESNRRKILSEIKMLVTK